MSSSPTSPVSPIPEHLHTVTPRLVVHGADSAIAFYCRAFAAEEISERFSGPNGEVIHAEIRIGDSVVMITEGPGDTQAPAETDDRVVSAIMATYWENVDAAWERAVGAGAEIIHPLTDQFYGERGGRLRDPFGQQWMMSKRIELLTPEQLDRRATDFFGSS